MLLMSDSTIIDLPQVSGSTAAAIDSEGVFWFARGNSGELLSIEPMGEVMQYKVSQSFVVDATVGTSTADEVHFFGTGVDGNVGVMSFSPTADEDVSQSLARFGDLLFLIIVFFCISIIIQLFYVNELKPW
jgi:phosphotransferase system  glucose/maltose/N-acetylglucosamine-specific IIC component